MISVNEKKSPMPPTRFRPLTIDSWIGSAQVSHEQAVLFSPRQHVASSAVAGSPQQNWSFLFLISTQDG